MLIELISSCQLSIFPCIASLSFRGEKREKIYSIPKKTPHASKFGSCEAAWGLPVLTVSVEVSVWLKINLIKYTYGLDF